MVGRADHEPLLVAHLLRALFAHALPAADRPVEEDVVPAAPVQDGDLDVGVALADVDAVPVRVARLVPHPLRVRLARMARGGRHLGEGQVPGVHQELVVVLLAVDDVGPAAHRAQAEGVVVVDPRGVDVGRRVAGGDALEVRVPERGDGPLRVAVVGLAGHADVAVAPRLGRHPVERLVAVLGLVDERLVDALRAPAAAHVLDHAGVAPSRPVLAVRRHGAVGLGLAVGHADEDGGEGRRHARAVGQVDVGQKAHAVRHRHPDVAADRAAGYRRRRAGGQCLIGRDDPRLRRSATRGGAPNGRWRSSAARLCLPERRNVPHGEGENSPVHDGVRGANASIVDTMIMTDGGVEIPAAFPAHADRRLSRAAALASGLGDASVADGRRILPAALANTPGHEYA